MRYTLRKMTSTTWDITSGGQSVGFVKVVTDGPKAGQFSARLGRNGQMAFRSTAAEAFHEVVAIRTRINWCGSNDPAKARAMLDAHNAEVRAQYELFGGRLTSRRIAI